MCNTRHSFKISHVWDSVNIVYAIEIYLLTILHIQGHLYYSRDKAKVHLMHVRIIFYKISPESPVYPKAIEYDQYKSI